MRTTELFNDNWLFALNDAAELPEVEFRSVSVPHDWSCDYELAEDAPTGGGGGYAAAGCGWYKNTLTVSAEDLKGRVAMQFDGVYMEALIYVNGVLACGHEYGYTSFTAELTPYLKEGENQIAVRVDNSHQPNCRWYSGSGIYRNVWLIKSDPVHVAPFGIRAGADGIYPVEGTAALQILAEIANDSTEAADSGIVYRLFDKEGNVAAEAGASLILQPGEKSDCMVRMQVPDPIVWDVENPYLYTLEGTVLNHGKEVDQVCVRVGIRTATFDANKGFLLNGERVKIKGMCLHHDCGLTGAVGYVETWRRRLMMLKDMGCNGVRCAHNPPTPEFLDLCDELGFLVMDEIYDEWMLVKDKNNNYYSQKLAYGSGRFFKKTYEQELVSMLRRDYCHPSVIIWSIGNEIPEQSSSDGVRILKELQDICHREDTTRMVTSACDNIVAPAAFRTRREFENALDVVGYNYVGRWRERAETFYEQDREEFPNRRFIGTENPSAGGVRGQYTDANGYRSYAKATMGHEALWRYTISHDFVSGDYLWTGIDYLGETRWPRRGATSGPIDSAGYAKDTFYYFRSIWNDKEVTLHLLPHWNWAGDEGEFKTVIAYTNCERVRLYINDKFVGEQGSECPRYGCTKSWLDKWTQYQPTTNDLHLTWTVPYEPGVLRAEGYIGEEKVLEEIIETTGETASIVACADAEKPAPGQIVHIDLTALDAQGRLVPTENCMVTCTVSDNMKLIGMDSGNMMDLTRYALSERTMMAGRLMAMVQAPADGSEGTVTFTAEGIEPVVVKL